MSSNTVLPRPLSCSKPTAGRPSSEVGSSVSRRDGCCSWRAASAASAGSCAKKVCDHARIERLAGFLLEQRQRRLVLHRPVIGTVGGERVEVVDHREDARAERDLVALQPLRIALAVPAFVVAEDERRHRVGERHRADDLGADLRVDADLLELLLGERSRLRQDVLGHRQLADVVEQRRGLHALDLVVGHAERLGDAGGVDLHAADVALRGLVLGVDGQRQRLDRRQVQVGHLLHVPPLVLDAARGRPCRCGR